MEGNCLSESPPRSADICCANELNRSNSNASTLTAENCEDILLLSANVKPDDSKIWTDEKHSLYLEQLEVSFLKQLHQSIGLLAKCPDQNKRKKCITEMSQFKVHKDSEQWASVPHGCQRKINSNRALADTPELLELGNTDDHGKLITSHGLDACPRQFSASSRDHDDSYDSMREGTGQNFVDEDNQTKSTTKSRVKRLKTALPD